MLALGPRVADEGSKLAVHSSACFPCSWGWKKKYIYQISLSNKWIKCNSSEFKAARGEIHKPQIFTRVAVLHWQSNQILRQNWVNVPSRWSVRAAESGWKESQFPWQEHRCRVQRGAVHSLADTLGETAHLLALTGDCKEQTGSVLPVNIIIMLLSELQSFRHSFAQLEFANDLRCNTYSWKEKCSTWNNSLTRWCTQCILTIQIHSPLTTPTLLQTAGRNVAWRQHPPCRNPRAAADLCTA